MKIILIRIEPDDPIPEFVIDCDNYNQAIEYAKQRNKLRPFDDLDSDDDGLLQIFEDEGGSVYKLVDITDIEVVNLGE